MSVGAGMCRLTVVEQVSRKLEFKGRPLAVAVSGPAAATVERSAAKVLKNLRLLLKHEGVIVEIFTPFGFKLDPNDILGMSPAQIDDMAKNLDASYKSKEKVEIPEMYDCDSYEISEAVTVKQFKLIMGMDFKFEGEGADRLNALIKRPSGKELIGVSRNDALAYAALLSGLTGDLFRLPTVTELAYFVKRHQTGGLGLSVTDTRAKDFYDERFYKELENESAYYMLFDPDYYGQHEYMKFDTAARYEQSALILVRVKRAA